MRTLRNFALLLILLLAPFAAHTAKAFEVGASATCGDCTCNADQCCDKSWAGGCSCHVCAPAV